MPSNPLDTTITGRDIFKEELVFMMARLKKGTKSSEFAKELIGKMIERFDALLDSYRNHIEVITDEKEYFEQELSLALKDNKQIIEFRDDTLRKLEKMEDEMADLKASEKMFRIQFQAADSELQRLHSWMDDTKGTRPNKPR